jgi:hypothetical protein
MWQWQDRSGCVIPSILSGDKLEIGAIRREWQCVRWHYESGDKLENGWRSGPGGCSMMYGGSGSDSVAQRVAVAMCQWHDRTERVIAVILSGDKLEIGAILPQNPSKSLKITPKKLKIIQIASKTPKTTSKTPKIASKTPKTPSPSACPPSPPSSQTSATPSKTTSKPSKTGENPSKMRRKGSKTPIWNSRN